MSSKQHSQSAPVRFSLDVETLEDRTVPAVAGASTFVQNLYQQVLGRGADEIGLRGYVSRIDGGASREEIAKEVWESQEHRSQQILDLYQNFIGRAPKLEEYRSWLEFFNSGRSYEDAVASFATSDEFNNQRLTTKLIVSGYYDTLLGRTGTTGEIQKYVDALSKGQIEKRGLVDGIIEGAEFRGDVVDSLYLGILNRESDKAGHDGYAAALTGRTDVDDVAVSLLASDEFFARKAA